MCIYDATRFLCGAESLYRVEECPLRGHCIPHVRSVILQPEMCSLCSAVGLELGSFIGAQLFGPPPPEISQTGPDWDYANTTVRMNFQTRQGERLQQLAEQEDGPPLSHHTGTMPPFRNPESRHDDGEALSATIPAVRIETNPPSSLEKPQDRIEFLNMSDSRKAASLTPMPTPEAYFEPSSTATDKDMLRLLESTTLTTSTLVSRGEISSKKLGVLPDSTEGFIQNITHSEGSDDAHQEKDESDMAPYVVSDCQDRSVRKPWDRATIEAAIKRRSQ